MRIFLRCSIIAFLILGCSENSNPGNSAIVPLAPTELTATVVSTNQVILLWMDNANNELGYKIQRKINGGNFSDIASTGPNVNTYNDLGLTSNTTYTYRIYAYNSAGNSTQYSNEVTVSTDTIIDLLSVTIGTQIWSKKNLDVAKYRNGDPIPNVTEATQWQNLTTGAWCWYNNDSTTYAAAYGRLYNWYAVNDPRGLAPQGWHVPTEADWNLLVKYLDASADTVCQSCFQSATAGGAMKTITGWNSPNTGATNSSGFTGLPAGSRYRGGPFSDVGDYTYWWSASEFGNESAWLRNLYYYNSTITRYNNLKSHGYSVRVIRD